jgi:2-desacetyl-2-hydroxyethyl bacteriochlorophyllide A dehydrogenase
VRAAVARAGRIVVEDVADPVPAEGQVLVASLACGICGSDLHMLDALGALGPEGPPLVFGHEFCAEVLDHGPGTGHRFPPGTRVCALPWATGPDGPELVGYSARFPGGFGERLVVDGERLVAVPDSLPTDHAALTEPLAVGVHAAATARLVPGAPALVVGCGPVGLAVVAALRARRHGPIVAADFAPARRARAERLGADVVVDPADHSPYERWTQLGPGPLPTSPLLGAGVGPRPPAPVVFECVGVPGVLQQVIDGAPVHGHVVVVGACLQPDTIQPATAITKELSLDFVFAYRPAEFAEALDLLATGAVDPSSFITGSVALGDVEGAFTRLRAPDDQVKILVRPGDQEVTG